MRFRSVVSLVVGVAIALPLFQCSSEVAPYPGGTPPGLVPQMFAPGLVSSDQEDFWPAFSPDMTELYFTRRNPPQPANIMFMSYDGNRWLEPELAPFCVDLNDGTPAFSPDGNTLYFSSNRILEEGPQSFEASNIWKVTKTKTGWSEPEELGPPVNSTSWERSPTIARDGTMYFQSDIEGSLGRTDIYMAVFEKDQFAMPVNLGAAVNTAGVEANPCVAPDQSWLVFYSYGRADGFGGGDLYVSFKDSDGEWAPAVNLGRAVNSEAEENFPTLSPDGKYLFFSSTRGGKRSSDIYWVDAAVIETARP
ncbi:MAG: PD40 domain-containing protein [Candidatus Latescibacterota bacterium]|nr:MAG: PD40 domain-containing protein [Candidatus Latescibacterota bacterium]